MSGTGRVQSWDDLPKQPWPEATEPPIDDLVTWLLSLDREQLTWLFDKKRQDWRRDSDCFMRKVERRATDDEIPDA